MREGPVQFLFWRSLRHSLITVVQALLLVVLCSGCAALMTKCKYDPTSICNREGGGIELSSEYFDHDEVFTYSGTRFDVKIAGADPSFLNKFLALVDLPLSFVFDTLFLPADLFGDWGYNRKSSED